VIRPRSRLLPTARPFPAIDPDDRPVRVRLYSAAKRQPITAQTGATITRLPLTEALDHLRVLENWKIVKAKATDEGIIYWHRVPGNNWETPAPPF